jgi:hypothetical protein
MNHRTGPMFGLRQSAAKGVLLAAAFLGAMLWALGGQAQPVIGPLIGAAKGSHQKDKEKPPVQKENRFLFIVDTSSSMRADALYVRDSITDLLKSAMQGQLRDGDTVGLWNYDDELHTDFPMQVWSSETRPVICERVAAYLTDREYRKKARLEKVLPFVQKLIANSRLITIVFIYDGSQPMRGTPFDKDINDIQKQFLKEVRAASLPFVTILAARQGTVFEYTVNVPNSVVVPHTAEPLKDEATNAPATNAPPVLAVETNAVIPAPPAPPPRFEIVLSGSHAHRTNAPPADASTAPPAGSTEQAPASNVTPPPVAEPSTAAPSASEPATLGSVTPSPDNSPAAAGGGDGPAATPPNSASAAVPLQSQSVPAVAPAVTPGVAATAPGQSTIPHTTATVRTVAAAMPIAGSDGAAPRPTQSAKPEPPATPKPPPTDDEHSRARAETIVDPDGRITVLAPVARLPVAPAAVSTIGVASTGDHIALLVIALSLLTIAVVLVVFLMRRTRGGAQPSLISQSIDRSP